MAKEPVGCNEKLPIPRDAAASDAGSMIAAASARLYLHRAPDVVQCKQGVISNWNCMGVMSSEWIAAQA